MKACSVNECEREAKSRGMCGMHAERRRTGRPVEGPPRRRQLREDELWAADPETGCWNWQGYVAADGYGKRNATLAHRWVYLRSGRTIPEGLVLDHLCRNTRCVNPDHLEPVTIAVNSYRGEHPNFVAWRENKCTKGHEYDEANTYRNKSGTRECRKCHANTERERQRRLREQRRGDAA